MYMTFQKLLLFIVLVSTILGVGIFYVLNTTFEKEGTVTEPEKVKEQELFVQQQEEMLETPSFVVQENKPVSLQEVPIVVSAPETKTYSAIVVQEEQLTLQNNEVLEIVDTHYIAKNNILLKDNATLVIRDSKIEHQKDYTFQYEIKAIGNSKVIIEDSVVSNNCTGSWNLNFLDTSSF